MGRFLLTAAAAGATLLVVAAPAGARRDDVRTVTKSFNASAGTSSFALTCPRGFVALGGGPVTLPDGVELGRSLPGQSRRSWLLGFSSQAPATVRGEVRCANVSFHGKRSVRYQLGTVAVNEITVAAGSSLRVNLKCTNGLVPTGIGQDQTPVPGGGPRRPGAIDIRAASPQGRGFVLRLHNGSTTRAEGDYYLRCLKRSVNGQRLKVGKHSFSDQLDASGQVGHSCKRGQSALTTGWSLVSPDISLRSTYLPGTRGGRWLFRYGRVPRRVKTALLCLE
jgi:hypothetical protein